MTGVVAGATTGSEFDFWGVDIIGGTSLGVSDPNSDMSSVSTEIGFIIFFCKDAKTPKFLFILSILTQLAFLWCKPYIFFNNPSNSVTE